MDEKLEAHCNKENEKYFKNFILRISLSERFKIHTIDLIFKLISLLKTLITKSKFFKKNLLFVKNKKKKINNIKNIIVKT